MTIPPRQKPASLNFEIAGQLHEKSEPIADRALHGRPSLCKTPFAFYVARILTCCRL